MVFGSYIIDGVLVYVDDVQPHFENSRKLGAGTLSDLEFGEPGTRYRAEDLEGQRWMFIQRIQGNEKLCALRFPLSA